MESFWINTLGFDRSEDNPPRAFSQLPSNNERGSTDVVVLAVTIIVLVSKFDHFLWNVAGMTYKMG